MNRRTVHIVQILSQASVQSSLESLAAQLGVSERTIRNDIKALNLLLGEQSLGEIGFGPRGAIVLPDDFSRVEAMLPVEDTFAYKMSSDERKELGAAILIEATDYVTLGEIAETFSVSRATILNDLDGIKQRIADAGLRVESKPSRGVRVIGAESLRRLYLLDFIDRKAPVVDQWFSLPVNAPIRLDSVTIRKILNERCHAHGITMPDAPFETAVNHLCLSVLRNRNGRPLEELGLSYRGLSADSIGEFETDVVDLVGQYCSVEMGANEALFFEALGRGLGYQGGRQFDVEDMRVQKLSRAFIRDLSLAIGIDLNGDYDLFEYLSNHLKSMFASGPSLFPETLELKEIVRDQPEVLEAVEKNVGPLASYAGREITSVETMYVALHVCAALERRKSRRAYSRVVVVCDGGIGTSRLLAEELCSQFDIRVVKVMPAHELPYIGSYRADLVISTVPLEDCPIEHVVISFPLRDGDRDLVREKLSTIVSKTYLPSRRADEVSAQGLIDALKPIVIKHMGKDSELINEMCLEVRRYFREAQHLEGQLLSPYLHQLLPASHIRLDVRCADWRDAIRKSAQPLLEQGYIEERYIDSMVKGVERYGPYVVLAPGFAVPHSAPARGVVKMGMSLIRLSEPVAFGCEESDPIEFVCTLGAIDGKAHLRAFANLLDMVAMDDDAFLADLRGAKDSADAAAVIERHEYEVIRR